MRAERSQRNGSKTEDGGGAKLDWREVHSGEAGIVGTTLFRARHRNEEQRGSYASFIRLSTTCAQVAPMSMAECMLGYLKPPWRPLLCKFGMVLTQFITFSRWGSKPRA